MDRFILSLLLLSSFLFFGLIGPLVILTIIVYIGERIYEKKTIWSLLIKISLITAVVALI